MNTEAICTSMRECSELNVNPPQASGDAAVRTHQIDEIYQHQLLKPDLINRTARCAVEGGRDWRSLERINQRRF